LSSADRTRLPLSLLFAVAIALVVSGMRPYDRLTWWLEVLPVLVAAPLLVATHRRFPLTPLAYWLIAIHSLVLILGGHYTYARVPLGFWMQDWFDFSRNHYDRIGHLMQGFGPAIVIRELLIRTSRCSGSAPRTNSPNGGRHSPAARQPELSSARRAMSGTLSGTCSSPAAEPSPRRCCSRDCMIASSPSSTRALARRSGRTLETAAGLSRAGCAVSGRGERYPPRVMLPQPMNQITRGVAA
jgi:hypothetical protein